MMFCNVYVDFDGTIAPGEPTDALFDQFADPSWRQIEDEWQKGRLSSRECMSGQVALLRATPTVVDEFLRGVEIDPHFPEFVKLCSARGARVIVVSDGLDRVVGSALRNAGLELPFFANRLKWQGGDRWTLEFPHARLDCRSAMGNCKCGHRRTRPGSLEVMVGDGRSDFCLAERAHLVLAKSALASHCVRMGLPHAHIENFSDAGAALSSWLDTAETSVVVAGWRRSAAAI
ncbi:MAG: HAD-IB family phosphatase [Bacteroidota bacterium]|jgi:2,3-diketo-5-methylthio-1-phosphopentane phosphatase